VGHKVGVYVPDTSTNGWTRSLNGVPWFKAKRPRRWHKHWAQTKGMGVERCACGATRPAGYPWWAWLK
jgi:hypothetical protein